MGFPARAVYELMIGWARADGYFQVGYSDVSGPDVLAADQFAYNFDGAHDDMTEQLDSATVTRGRADDLGPMRSGESQLLVIDPDGLLNTANPASPIASLLSIPWRPVRLTATFEAVTYPLYYGFTDRITFEPRGRSGYAQIETFDLFSRLTDKPRVVSTGPVTTGEAIRRLLAMIQFTERLALDPGDVIASMRDDGDAEILQVVEDIMLATRGTFFIRADGTAVHEERATRILRAVEQTVSAIVSEVAPGIDPSRITNKWTVTRTDQDGNVVGTPQTIADTSEDHALLGERSNELTTPYLPDDGAALSLANYLTFLTSRPVSSVWATVIEGRTPALLHAILGTELQRRVVVDEPQGGTDLDGWVEQITHQIGQGRTHRTGWAISKRGFDYFVVGDSEVSGPDVLAL